MNASEIYDRIRAACCSEHGLSSDRLPDWVPPPTVAPPKPGDYFASENLALDAHARVITLDVLRALGLVRA